MPKLEPAAIANDVGQNRYYAFYWIYGPEKYKQRRLVNAIIESLPGFSMESIEASEHSPADVLDLAQTTGLFSTGKKIVIVKSADQWKDLQVLLDAITIDKGDADALDFIIIALAQSFDGRKKTSKAILEKAAVADCAAVEDEDRLGWIETLAERCQVQLNQLEMQALKCLEPWTLDIVQSEIEKLGLLPEQDRINLIAGVGNFQLRERVLNALFTRDRQFLISHLPDIAQQPQDFTLPFLGLIIWNARQLEQFLLQGRGMKINPFLREKLDRWVGHWSTTELRSFMGKLYQLDLNSKTSKSHPMGQWLELAI
jgi:DNA polymerase III delta subunit